MVRKNKLANKLITSVEVFVTWPLGFWASDSETRHAWNKVIYHIIFEYENYPVTGED
jgi:hypothetical protein